MAAAVPCRNLILSATPAVFAFSIAFFNIFSDILNSIYTKLYSNLNIKDLQYIFKNKEKNIPNSIKPINLNRNSDKNIFFKYNFDKEKQINKNLIYTDDKIKILTQPFYLFRETYISGLKKLIKIREN